MILFRSLLGDMKVIKEDQIEDKTFDALTFKRTEGRGPKFGQTMDFKPERGFSDSAIGSDFQARGKRKPYEDKSYEQSVTYSMRQRRRVKPDSQQLQQMDRTNLFTGEDIGIFEPNMKESADSPKMLNWDRHVNDELQYIVAQPPKNAFEEMILLTEEGKLWKFPINNEQGMF